MRWSAVSPASWSLACCIPLRVITPAQCSSSVLQGHAMSNSNSGWGRAEHKYKGLTNRGATCYLNSVLQVLFMTKEFRDAVESFCHSESSNTSYIDAQLKDLFIQLNTGSPTTEYIICKLGIENVRKQQDVAEYFEKILSLASPEASKVFHGRLIHRTSCSCGVSTNEHNPFWTLNLPINNGHNGVYNVEDGLKGFFSQSKLTGDNQVYCDECEAKADATTGCEVELYPKVLVLLLKRFEFSYDQMDYVKNNCPVDVPLDIEMPKGVSYELYATVDHVGNLRGGHYTATIQSPDDGGSWYDFNDSTVTPINNFNPERSQSGYLLFYRKTQNMDVDDSFYTPPSSSRPLDQQPVDVVMSGVDAPECGDVKGGYDISVRFDAPEIGHVTEIGHEENERLDGKGGKHIKRDKALPTNENESCKPGDQAGQQEASSTAPMISDPEGGDNERWGVFGEGQTEGEGIQKTDDDGNTDHDRDGDDHHSTPSSSGPMVKQPVSAGSSDVTGGDDVIECGDVGTGGEVGAGDPQSMESERLDGKGGESMTTGLEVPTNEKESRKSGDQARQQEANGVAPKVNDPEGEVNERRRGQRESTALLEVFEEGETEGRVIQKEGRNVISFRNCLSLSGMCLSSRPSSAKHKQGRGDKVDMIKDKSIKKRRKKNLLKVFLCSSKQTSDTE